MVSAGALSLMNACGGGGFNGHGDGGAGDGGANDGGARSDAGGPSDTGGSASGSGDGGASDGGGSDGGSGGDSASDAGGSQSGATGDGGDRNVPLLFTVGGSISGLVINGLVLANGNDTLEVNANATRFTLLQAVALGSDYHVLVKTDPAGLTCSVANGSGTMGPVDVTDVAVTCVTNNSPVGGSVSGLGSSGLVLSNGTDTLSVPANAASFSMPTAVAFGSSYDVKVKLQPQTHECSVLNGKGTMGAQEVNSVAVFCVPATYTVSTFAGSGTAGSTDAVGKAASFNSPDGLAVDEMGNVYVAERTNRIRKITPNGTVSTFAGSGTAGSADGLGTAASFNVPRQLAFDASGNLYVADQNNRKIRKITANGSVSTFAGSGASGGADGAGTVATFSLPTGIAVDGGGNVYVGDPLAVRKITPSAVVSTLAPVDNSIGLLPGLAIDTAGNVCVVAPGTVVKKVSPAGGVSEFAGGVAGDADGVGPAAQFGTIALGLAADANGNLYVSDTNNRKIRRITPSGVVTTLAGSGSTGSIDGPALSASFNAPVGLAVDASGNVFVSDLNNHKVRKITRN